MTENRSFTIRIAITNSVAVAGLLGSFCAVLFALRSESERHRLEVLHVTELEKARSAEAIVAALQEKNRELQKKNDQLIAANLKIRKAQQSSARVANKVGEVLPYLTHTQPRLAQELSDAVSNLPLPPNKPGGNHGPIGIDMNHWDIDGAPRRTPLTVERVEAALKHLKSRGVCFAFIKATEGVTFTDPTFDINWAAAGRAGILRGAYHYLSFQTSGADQARHMYEVVQPQPSDLPLLVGVEPGRVDKRLDSFRSKAGILKSFVREIEKLSNRKVIIAGPRDLCAFLADDPDLKANLRWTGSTGYWGGHSHTGATGKRVSCDFEQYSRAGQMEGLSKKLHLEVFNGSLDQLRALTSR
ncbi:glycoside hydrolase family 25 protein [Fimbriimonas ginsengisoli]|uniref:Glycosyl hydrolase family 25 protein n=1 Tax=Fimbriimonas ginsengisoli Gsoil 348 TaxID=661478 RepID=A0A068NWP5_FIMGI|nr:glycoside hydrolase family 25 protein [Fimbriimonas ginsengisoli]AIE87190.1 glycosyl hydrolase family 25 protein [Fimbriimonas ginsengisoli Gsoil 348]